MFLSGAGRHVGRTYRCSEVMKAKAILLLTRSLQRYLCWRNHSETTLSRFGTQSHIGDLGVARAPTADDKTGRNYTSLELPQTAEKPDNTSHPGVQDNLPPSAATRTAGPSPSPSHRLPHDPATAAGVLTKPVICRTIPLAGKHPAPYICCCTAIASPRSSNSLSPTHTHARAAHIRAPPRRPVN